ncbi:hypothetical protein ACDQ55_17950 [Chitinophaga sp. 30R24]|uniref:hypothetical protein n=1 Tax=Chitinophaga sp. 30R24 TaxID=3248838 RepID=UPI003B8FD21A
MKRIALYALLSGIVLAAAAYITEMNDLPGAVELRTPGFIGYIFIISSIAWFSLNTLYQWGREAEVAQAAPRFVYRDGSLRKLLPELPGYVMTGEGQLKCIVAERVAVPVPKERESIICPS